MAKLLNAALMLSLLLFITMQAAESRKTAQQATVKFFEGNSGPTCEAVTGVASGDTCAAIAHAFELSEKRFEAINPNINCSDLFIGQWVCVIGTTAA